MNLRLQPQLDDARKNSMISSDTVIAQAEGSEMSIAPTVEAPPEHADFLLSLHELEAEMLEVSQAIDRHLPTSAGKIIQLIGTCTGEGTTTISRAFATISAVRLDKKVLLVTEPSPTHVPGTDEPAPLNHEHREVSIAMTSSPIWGAPQGSILRSPRVRNVFHNLRQHHDLVVIDSLPVLTSTDAFAISPHVDGTILIVEAETTRWTMVQRVKDRLVKAGGTPLGVILNKRCYHIPPSIYKFL